MKRMSEGNGNGKRKGEREGKNWKREGKKSKRKGKKGRKRARGKGVGKGKREVKKPHTQKKLNIQKCLNKIMGDPEVDLFRAPLILIKSKKPSKFARASETRKNIPVF